MPIETVHHEKDAKPKLFGGALLEMLLILSTRNTNFKIYDYHSQSMYQTYIKLAYHYIV
jgi:hypothetical protein